MDQTGRLYSSVQIVPPVGNITRQTFQVFTGGFETSHVGRNKPVRALARTDIANMDVGKEREQERKLFRQTLSKFAGNATSRYALGWPYSGLHLIPSKKLLPN